MDDSLEDKVKDEGWLSFKSSSSIYGWPSFKMKRKVPLTRDWKLIWDEDKYPQEFPQNIYSTPKRPDVVVWTEKVKEVILIELTVKDENKFGDQVVRNEARYNKNIIPGIIAAGLKAWLFTIEVGCSDFWHHTVPALLN